MTQTLHDLEGLCIVADFWRSQIMSPAGNLKLQIPIFTLGIFAALGRRIR